MALFDTTWYVNYGDGSTTGYWAVTVRPQNTAVAAGVLRRQASAPAVGSERVFVCIVAGTTANVADATWTLTRGAKTTDGTATWQECTGASAVNGDVTNTPVWTAAAVYTLGQIIKRVNAASYWICSTAGTAGGSEPAWANNTAGTTRTDNTATWTCLGVVGNFTGWQAPHARLENAYASTWGAAGNSFYVKSSSLQTQSSALTLTCPGTGPSPCFTYCVTGNNAPPVSGDLTTGASVATTGANAITVQNSGGCYFYGMTFTAGSSGSANLTVGNGTGNWFVFERCALQTGGTNAGNIPIANGGGASVQLINTTFAFGSTSGLIAPLAVVDWINTPSAITGSNIPTSFVGQGNQNTYLRARGVDLSALGSGNTIVAAATRSGVYRFEDCKLGASVTKAGVPTVLGATVDFIRCDSAGTNYTNERYKLTGTQTVETTIVRTDGATDGVTPISWKIVSTASTKWTLPFESQPITIWNDSTSAITTLTIYGTTTGGGVPNNDDVWAEVEYLGSASTPVASFITSTKADNLAAAAATNNSSDASTWGGSGAGNGFKIVVPSFTPAVAGPINIVIKVGKVTSTYYFDPKPSITGATVSKSFMSTPGVYANERARPAALINSGALVG